MSDVISRGFVDIAEGQAHYRACGAKGLPVLVMFHGSPGSSFSLTPLMRHLGKRRRVIASRKKRIAPHETRRCCRRLNK